MYRHINGPNSLLPAQASNSHKFVAMLLFDNYGNFAFPATMAILFWLPAPDSYLLGSRLVIDTTPMLTCLNSMH